MSDASLHLRFNAETHPDPEQRAAAWREAMSLSVDVAFEPAEKEVFEGRLDFFSLGSILLVDASTTAHTMIRDADTIARTGDEHIIVDAFLSGGFRGAVDTKAIAVGPGDGFVMDLRGTLRVRIETSRFIGAIIPRTVFEAHRTPTKGLHGVRLAAGSPEAGLLGHLIEGFLAQAPRLSAPRATDLGFGLTALVGACIGRSRKGRVGVQSISADATRARIARYVERHAVDPGLNAASLCAAFGLSRTTLYRLFQSEGGISEMIRRRRAGIAHRLLRDARHAALSIESVALASGFSEARSLNRALRDLHGTSPSRLRREALDRAEPTPEDRIRLGAMFDALDP